MNTPTDASAVAVRLYEIFDTGDVAALDEVLAADLVDHNPVPGTTSGIEGIRLLVTAIATAFTGTHHEVPYVGTTTDGWVVGHWRMTGKHTGDWFGTPATGSSVSFTGTDLMRISDGKVTEIRHVEELLQLQQQLTASAAAGGQDNEELAATRLDSGGHR